MVADKVKGAAEIGSCAPVPGSQKASTLALSHQGEGGHIRQVGAVPHFFCFLSDQPSPISAATPCLCVFFWI